jgi:1-pyrroline-5-carboxylate dehydrogenase
MVTDTVLASRDFAGYTLQDLLTYLKIWAKIETTLKTPKNCRETGGKDFIIAHSSANPKQVSTGIVRGA